MDGLETRDQLFPEVFASSCTSDNSWAEPRGIGIGIVNLGIQSFPMPNPDDTQLLVLHKSRKELRREKV